VCWKVFVAICNDIIVHYSGDITSDSSVGITSNYSLDSWGLISRRDRDFSPPHCGQTLSLVVKWLDCEVDHLTTFSAEPRIHGTSHAYPLYAFMA
jgi:hypothetical protein